MGPPCSSPGFFPVFILRVTLALGSLRLIVDEDRWYGKGERFSHADSGRSAVGEAFGDEYFQTSKHEVVFV